MLQNVLDRLASGTERPLQVLVELLLIGLAVNWCAGVLHGTRGTRLLRGLLVLLVVATLVVRVLASSPGWARLELLYYYFLIGLAFIALVAFQPELRRALMRAGDVGFMRRTSPHQKLIAALVETAGYLSRNKYGGLVAIQREIGLANWAENGTTINAEVSADLLKSIFFPNSPLHDLGVVIRDTRVRAASCQFPVAESGEVDGSLGSRHRAAVGLSSESDALVLVVSEETGTISLADSGKLHRFLSLDDLAEELNERLRATRSSTGRTVRSLSDIWRYVRRFLVVAPLAMVIWFLADQASLTRSEEVRIRLRILNDSDRAVDMRPASGELRLTVRGTKRQVDRLVSRTASEPLQVSWRLSEAYQKPNEYAPTGLELVQIVQSTSEMEQFDLVVESISPSSISFDVDEVLTFADVPIVVSGRDREVEVAEISSPRVSVQITARKAAQLGNTIDALPLDLSDRLENLAAGSARRFDGVVLPTRIDGVPLVGVDPAMVDLTVQVVAEQVRRKLERIAVDLNVAPQVLETTVVERRDPVEWLLNLEVEGDRRVIADLEPSQIRGSVRIRISDAIVGNDFKAFEVDLSLPPGVQLVSPPPTVQLRFQPSSGDGT